MEQPDPGSVALGVGRVAGAWRAHPVRTLHWAKSHNVHSSLALAS
jgi:hypothetical protein